MTNRYQPNETAAPVALDTLALLLRSGDTRAQAIIAEMDPLVRARLAVFCVGRCHMRSLGLDIAAQCDERTLWLAAGKLGTAVYDQSRDRANFDREPSVYRRKSVTLAKRAA